MVPCRPHSWLFNEPYYAIDENFERFDHEILPPHRATVNKIALFHYVVKCVAACSWEHLLCVDEGINLHGNDLTAGVDAKMPGMQHDVHTILSC